MPELFQDFDGWVLTWEVFLATLPLAVIGGAWTYLFVRWLKSKGI